MGEVSGPKTSHLLGSGGQLFCGRLRPAGLNRMAEQLDGARGLARLAQVVDRWVYSACLCFALLLMRVLVGVGTPRSLQNRLWALFSRILILRRDLPTYTCRDGVRPRLVRPYGFSSRLSKSLTPGV